MKNLLIFILFGLLGLSSCKKDSGIEEPAALQDFSGLYYMNGHIEVLSNPIETLPFQRVVTAADQGKYHVGTLGSYSSTGSRWTISGIYAGESQFKLIVYGGPPVGNGNSDAHWTVEELNTIFQPGKQLSYGTGFGQAGVELYSFYLPGEYWSLWADNSANNVVIEEVNDMETYFPDKKWVKQVVVRFDVHLKHVFDNDNNSVVSGYKLKRIS